MELTRRIFDRERWEYLYVVGAILLSGLCAYFLPFVAVPVLLIFALAFLSLTPKTLVACFVAFIPFHLAVLNVFEISGGEVGAYSILGGLKDLLFMAILAASFVFVKLGGKLNKPRALSLALFLIFLMAMAFHIPDQGLRIGLMGFKASAEFLFAFLLGASLGAIGLRPAIWALVVSGFIAAIYGFFQVAAQGITYILGVETITLAGRASGVFGNLYASNSYGIYLVVVILAAFYLFEDSRGFKKAFALTAVLVASIALVLTFSRRSWLALIVGILAYSYFAKSKKAAIPILTAGIAGVLIAPSFFIDRLKLLFSLADTSAVGRFIEWRAILQDVLSGPFVALWGLGLGAYGTVPVSLKLPGAINSHNYYLLLLGQLGIVGLVIFLALVGASIASGIKKCSDARKSPEASSARLLAMILSGIFAMLVASFFGIVIETFPANFIFWLFCGALVSVDTEGYSYC